MPDDGIKRIDIAEFREFGYLQEVNRLFLHPLGLALEVVQEEDDCFACGATGKVPSGDCNVCGGTGKLMRENLGGVWDSREDPEGFEFGEDLLDLDKALRVAVERERRLRWRRENLGWEFQPVKSKEAGS